LKEVKKIDFKMAGMILMGLLSCFIVFHFLILLGVIPYGFVWGGWIENTTQMYVFEVVSLIINLLAITIVAIKSGYTKLYVPEKIVKLLLWIFVILFALNTVGNLFAQSKLEMLIFTPFTFICTIFFYRMAIEDQDSYS
jgi:hypothetical protein